MKNFFENLKKMFTGTKPEAEESKVESVKVGEVPPLKEQKGEGTKIGHGIKGHEITEGKKKGKKRYFPKQKGRGTKNHGLPREKYTPASSEAGEIRDKTRTSTEKTKRFNKPKSMQDQNDSPYPKRENVKKS